MTYKKNCSVCNKVFETNNPLKKTCSAECSKENARYLSRKYYWDSLEKNGIKRHSDKKLENIRRNREIYYLTKGTEGPQRAIKIKVFS